LPESPEIAKESKLKISFFKQHAIPPKTYHGDGELPESPEIAKESKLKAA
jgi:hypothetical protein